QSSNNFVTIGGINAVVTASTTVTLSVVVPENPISGVITVTVDENTVHTQQAFAVIPPAVEPPGDIVVYNAITPNGDNRNDIFLIDKIGDLPQTKKNKVVIINRWGDVVFSVNDYDNIS